MTVVPASWPATVRSNALSCVTASLAFTPLSLSPVKDSAPAAGALLSTVKLITLLVALFPAESVTITRNW